ncbi:phosphogluconate dehydrogenase, NAD binding domain protein [Cooperia oncophora]
MFFLGIADEFIKTFVRVHTNDVMGEADIAVIGLAVMGQNLILNMNDHGFTVCAFNRTVSKVDDFLKNEAKGTKIIGAHSMEEMCNFDENVHIRKLKRPRRVMMLVKAGAPVDSMIANVVPSFGSWRYYHRWWKFGIFGYQR